MSTGIITIICAVIGSSALAEIIRSIVGAIQRKRGKVWLMPHNTSFSPIDGTRATILGRVVTVLRKV